MNSLNEQEKSVVLAKAMGKRPEWLLREVGDGVQLTHVEIIDLYDPANMALAWQAHLWQLMCENDGEEYGNWWESENILIREDAQRLWLDKIIELRSWRYYEEG